jgi:hypothetical protein
VDDHEDVLAKIRHVVRGDVQLAQGEEDEAAMLAVDDAGVRRARVRGTRRGGGEGHAAAEDVREGGTAPEGADAGGGGADALATPRYTVARSRTFPGE